jgi:Tol biopolymer transport system component
MRLSSLDSGRERGLAFIMAMDRPPKRLALVFLLALLGGCSKDYPNPFAQGNKTVAPPASAAIVFTSGLWSAQANAPRELFALGATGGTPTQLTFCNVTVACDVIEPAPSPDRNRTVLRRQSAGDAGPGIVFVDLLRATEAVIVKADQQVSGADWSPQDGVIVFSASGTGGLEDLWRVDPNGLNPGNLTSTPNVRERRPRIDPGGSVAVYERIESGAPGHIVIFQSSTSQSLLTTGGPGTGALPGTGELVGSDTDPDFAPDNSKVVFRRLTSVGNGQGTWDILTVDSNTTTGATTPVAAGGTVFRGAPDWGPKGILFTEVDFGAGTAKLILVQPDGSGRQVLLTQPATSLIGNPRWLP